MRTLAACLTGLAVVLASMSASALLGMPSSLQGTIQSIEANTLTITSQQGDAPQLVEIQINAETQFAEGNSLATLKAGDEVEVKFKEEGQDKVAVSIAKVAMGGESPADESQAQPGYRS